jgi:diguanylate cyclase (GGDEF)-like protein/PAS domain S-box-containing protein
MSTAHVLSAPPRRLADAGIDPSTLFEAIVHHARSAVAVWESFPAGARSRLVYLNPTYTALTGYAADELLGTELGLPLGPESPPDLRHRITASLRAGDVHEDRITLLTKEGEPLWVEAVWYRIPTWDQSNAAEPFCVIGTYRDLVELQVEECRAAESLRRREEWAQALVRRGSDLILLTDACGTITWASPNSAEVIGMHPEQLLGTSCLDLVVRDDLGRAADAFAREAGGNPDSTPSLVLRVVHADGSPRWLSVSAVNMLDNEAVASIVISGHDVTEQRRADELLSDETSILKAIARGAALNEVLASVASMVERNLRDSCCSVGVIDGDGVARHRAAPSLAPRLVSLLDASTPDCELGRSVRSGEQVFRAVDADARWGPMGEELAHEGLHACWVWPVVASGSDELLGLLAVFVADDRAPATSELPLLARAQHLAAIAIDRARFEAQLEYQAVHDSLTGLPNRTLLLDRIQQAVTACRRTGQQAAVLFVDVDRFKVINDSLGHAAGDCLLQQVAERFRLALPPGDTIGRFGGDEFVVLGYVDGEDQAVALAELLASSLDRPFDVAGSEVVATCSIGIALADPSRDPEALVRDADAAMYRAKDEGRNRYALFEEHLHRRMVRRLELERDLRCALASDALELHYQPCVRLADGHVTGVEALVRWQRPGRGLVGAAQLVPVAEETGLIVPIGAWVLQEACRQAAAWIDDGFDLTISVNLSARQVADPGLVETVARTLQRTGLAPERLCLEVTESALAGDADNAVVVLGALKLLGVRLAIDDFGTGYATLDYVRRFSMADELKIDKTFVDGLSDLTVPDAAIVSAAIVLANALDFDTVAEGVENPEQLMVLRSLGCQRAQGYLFAKPVPPAEVVSYFTR